MLARHSKERWPLLCVILLLISGCAEQKRVATTQPPAAPAPSTQDQAPDVAQTSAPSTTAAKVAMPDPGLRQSGRILEQLIADPKNALPDGVLNRTACFAIFPDAGSVNGAVAGYATCRSANGMWRSPAAATLSGQAERNVRGDLLLFIMSDAARDALLRHKLDLGGKIQVAKGPLESERAILDPSDLARDVFAYARAGTALRGIELHGGSVTLDPQRTAALYGHDVDPQELLSSSTFSSTLTSFFNIDTGSFFNTIVPVGIIVHHSVLVPGGSPKHAEAVIDEFHDQRGFEISCFGKTYHIAYHYMILPDGRVRAGRPERCEGAHAHGYNSYLGVVLVGDFSSKDNPRGAKGPMSPTRAQMRSLIRLCRTLRTKYNIPLQHIMPHSEVARTDCPGDRLHFGEVLAALNDSPTRSGL